MTNEFDDFQAKIEQAKQGGPKSEVQIRKERDKEHRSQAMHAGMEFVVSIGIATAIGYFIDEKVGTMPLFLILFFFLGTGAGFMSLFKLSKNLGHSVGYSRLHEQEKQANKTPDLKNKDSQQPRKTEE